MGGELKDISLADDTKYSLIVVNNKYLIPSNMKEYLFKCFHKSHSKSLYPALKNLYIWRGMKSDCDKFLENCDICLRESPSLPHGEYQTKNSILGSLPNDILSEYTSILGLKII